MDVVKIGGAEGITIDRLAVDLLQRWRGGWRGVLVHGGSDATNQLAQQLGRPPEFVTSVSGHVSRRCDRETVEIFARATGLVNRLLVERLQGLGLNAFGLSGLDGRAVEARRKSAIRVVEDGRQRVIRDEWTGRPTGCNVPLLRSLLNLGHLPVIAPIGCGENGEMLNVDGDRVAAAVARAMNASNLVILSNVAGLMREFPDPTSVIPHVAAADLDSAARCAEGRMRKKVLGAREALDGGVQRVVIASASAACPVTDALSGSGTVIGAALDRGAVA